MEELVKPEERWNTLLGKKSEYLDIAEICAEYSMPTVFPSKSYKAGDKFNRNISTGFISYLVKNLAGKLSTTIIPTNKPFFKLSPSEDTMAQITGGDMAKKSELLKILAKAERDIMANIIGSNINTLMFSVMKLLIVTGNCLIERIDRNQYRVHTLRSYCVDRDYRGKILELIIREEATYGSLSEEQKSVIGEAKGSSDDEKIAIYTRTSIENDKYVLRTFIENKQIGSDITYDDIAEKFICVRWNRNVDEDYGRSFIEDVLPTIKALDSGLTVIDKSSKVNSKTVFCVNPVGSIEYDDFVEATNGSVIAGNPADVGVISADKTRDMSTLYDQIAKYKQELSQAFLVGSSLVRDAERVTAKEIQLLTNELQIGLSGIYGENAEDIQTACVLHGMEMLNNPELKKIRFTITTGIEAIDRTTELQKLNEMVAEIGQLAQLVGMEKIIPNININAIISSIVANTGVAGENFIYSEMEKQAIEQQMAQEEMAKQVISQAGGAFGSQAGAMGAEALGQQIQGEQNGSN